MDMHPVANPDLPATRAPRHDGWTPERQRAFLESIAEGFSVEEACRLVGMAPSSAYALRRRAAGATFALGWRAANLLAREKVADTLLARAIDGQVETYTRPDGATYTRHRYDNRLASTMLARLDRFADADAREATHHAARLVAAEFDCFLGLIDRADGPARAGLFLGERIVADELAPDLGAVVTLARADRWLRTGEASARGIDISDLDPDARAGWTAEQWARAEAAGLIAFATPDEPARHAPLSPLHPDDGVDDDGEAGEGAPVWWDSYRQEWRTRFAPPEDFFGEEEGEFGEEFYSRTLAPEEETVMDACHDAEIASLRAADAPERDAWFAALAAPLGIDGVDAAKSGGDKDDRPVMEVLEELITAAEAEAAARAGQPAASRPGPGISAI